jgi:hypothetical protein
MHRRALAVSLVIFMLAIVPIAADSTSINGAIAGIEICPQSICKAAIFIGDFEGQINGRPRSGAFLGAINHEDLPVDGGMSFITGGTWLIWTPLRTVSGFVLPGGTLTDNGNNTFAVEMSMVITKGGSGLLTFKGTLDHNPLLNGQPPTISGTISD